MSEVKGKMRRQDNKSSNEFIIMPQIMCLETWKISVNQNAISKILLYLLFIKYLKQNNNSNLHGSTKYKDMIYYVFKMFSISQSRKHAEKIYIH